MRRWLLDLLRCPECGSAFSMDADDAGDEVETGLLVCSECAARHPIKGGIPRFVPAENYAQNFGVQWNLFRRTQLDTHSGHPISRQRFVSYTGWSREQLNGQLVLDAGCGAGRFAEIALAEGARVVAVDFSSAIEAARENLHGKGEIEFIQADINALPFARETFPFVYCLGVIQHTPSPAKSFDALAAITARGGRLSLDVYPALRRNIFFAKYWIRPVTARLSAETSLKIVKRIFSPLYGLSQVINRIPLAGRYLKYLIPVVNYNGVYPLDREQLREWGLMDTFDMWAPAYDQPQSIETVRGWFAARGFVEIEVFRSGFIVGRGLKPGETG